MMKNMTLRRIAQSCGGTFYGEKELLDREVEQIVTDSRKAEAGSLFVAIKGERVDGHTFVEQVKNQGALCVLAEHELPAELEPYILVESSLQAVKDIAEEYLEELRIPVVGITGSVGKTSTKEMIAAILSQGYKVLKTDKNFNNELGLPLTVFNIRSSHEIAVLEMGINHFGEMHRLARIAKPDTCVITNIGQCHLEFLGDRDGVYRAKTEIFDFLRPDGHIVLNGDDDKLDKTGAVKGIEPVFFGLGAEYDIYADQIEPKGLKGISCRIHAGADSIDVTIPIPGTHMVYNALAGTAVGRIYGLTMEEIKRGIESLQPLSGRFHIIETDRYTIVDDCYNANPGSMKASLEVLGSALGRRVAILGDMGELGEQKEELHREVGAFAAGQNLDLVLCAGPLSREMAAAVNAAGGKVRAVHFETRDELISQLPEYIKQGDTILVKASHFMQYERIVSILTEKQ